MFNIGDAVLVKSEFFGNVSAGRVMAINVTEVPMGTETYKFDQPRYAILIEQTGTFMYPRMDDTTLITKAAWK